MKYKMVAIDLDDTLLADDLTISPQTVDVIQEAVNKGVIVTFATGRMYKSAKRYAKEIELNVPIITYQGAFVKNVFSDKALYEKCIPYDYAVEIIKKLKEKNKTVQMYINDELYTDKDNIFIEEYIKIAQVDYHVVDNLIDVLGKNDKLPLKIVTIDKPEEILKLLKEFKSEYKGKLMVNTSKPIFLEFSHLEASKGQAIEFLAEQNGIKMEEVIAIGDSYNDLDMISLAGLGVAMENADPKIKKVSGYITKTNNDHGVWEVFKKFVLAE